MKHLIAALFLALPAAAALAEEPPRPVVSEIVTADPARLRAFSGIVRGQDVTTLAFQTSGRLATLEVEAGDTISEGQRLATLDQITLEQDVIAARAELDAAEAEARLAEQRFTRTEALLERGVATEEMLEKVRASRDATAKQADAAQAQLAQAEDAARYGTLLAPRDAIVLSTSAEAGMIVSPGVAVLDIASPTGRDAVIDMPEAFATQLPADARFELHHHSGGVAPVMARLDLVEPLAATGLDTRRVRLTLIDPPQAFRIGTLITAYYTGGGTPLTTLPRSAIIGLPGAPQVWRVAPATRAVSLVPVETGADIGDRIEVKSGIAVGDEIVVRGVNSLKQGQIVGARVE